VVAAKGWLLAKLATFIGLPRTRFSVAIGPSVDENTPKKRVDTCIATTWIGRRITVNDRIDFTSLVRNHFDINDLAAFGNSDEEASQQKESVVSQVYLLCNTLSISVNAASPLLGCT
jgi:hypothetical protein